MTLDFTLLTLIGTLIVSGIGLSWFAGSDAPYVPTRIKSLKKMLEKAGLKKDHIFYELGSGDGRVVLASASLGATSTGIEQSWIRVWQSRLRAKQLNLQNADFIHGNIFDREYYPADVIFIFLLQPAVDRLEIKLRKELKKGCLIVTQTFHFKNWKPIKKLDFTENKKIRLGEGKYGGDFWIYKV